MGMFKAMRDLQKESRETMKTTDFGAMRKDGMARMQQAQEQMAQMTKQANLQATGVTCTATGAAVRDTGGMVNMEPIAELDLTVLPDGLPPTPGHDPPGDLAVLHQAGTAGGEPVGQGRPQRPLLGVHRHHGELCSQAARSGLSHDVRGHISRCHRRRCGRRR